MYRVLAIDGGFWFLVESDFFRLQMYYYHKEQRVMVQHMDDQGIAYFARGGIDHMTCML